MSKISKKEKNRIFHKYLVESMLLLHTMDELKQINEFNDTSIKFKDNLEYNTRECEELLKNVFKINSISSTTYIQELANKIDTVIRKNYHTIL